ncbi:MAG: hypothetical protein HYR74_09380 [Candidatus Eisenbacteria bacterium]|nr:hypothetical protein [Candidatus Eisenbacteria bacterium]
MRSWTLAALIAATALIPVAARAEIVARTSLDTLLMRAPDPPALRAQLAAYAEAQARTDTVLAARAFGYRAQSFAREGESDSAVACRERALAVENRPEWRLRLAEALIARLDPGDAARALEVLRPIQPRLPQLPDVEDAPAQALFSWSHYLGGHPDSAATLFAPLDAWLSHDPEWRYRLACVAIERGEWTRVVTLLTTLAVASRQQDGDVMDMAQRAASSLNAGSHLVGMIEQEIAKRDAIEKETLDDLGARGVVFAADDRFTLAGAVLRGAGRTHGPPAVVLVAPGDTLASYDSLALGLSRMGMPVMLLEPRGSGRSVGPTCPSHETWRGRELEMQSRVARDVHRAFLMLARAVGADSSRYLLIGVGETAPIAVEAATLDPRAQVLVLVSPSPDPVDRGAMRARLAKIRRPVYFQTGPEDFSSYDVTDALYRACDTRASRIADSDRPGHLTTIFRHDPRILTRIQTWLAESWPRAPRATPRARPRRR